MSVSPTRFINRWFCWAAAVSFVLAIPPAGLAAEAIHWQPDLETAKRLAAQQNKLVLVHIWAPCRKMEEEVFNNAALGRQLEAQYVAVKINTDDHPEAKQMFGIAAWPSDIILTPDGRVVEKLKGYRNSSQYGAVMAQLAAPYQTAATQVADARNPYGAARYQPQANPSAQQPTANTGNWDTQAGRYNPYGTSTPVAQAPVAKQNPAPQTPADRTAPPNATAEMKLRVDNPATPPVVQPAVASQNAVAPAAQLRVAETKPAGLPPLGLEGFCPVVDACTCSLEPTKKPSFSTIPTATLRSLRDMTQCWLWILVGMWMAVANSVCFLMAVFICLQHKRAAPSLKAILIDTPLR